MQIGTHIKDHRTRLGLSQDDLAMKIYVSRQTISNWETGDSQNALTPEPPAMNQMIQR